MCLWKAQMTPVIGPDLTLEQQERQKNNGGEWMTNFLLRNTWYLLHRLTLRRLL